MIGLSIDRVWVEDSNQVKLIVKSFFENKFKRRKDVRSKLEGIDFKKLSEEDTVMLCGRFGFEELKEAIWNCEGDEIPGPNGFNFKFIKNFWHLFKSDI